MTQLRPFGAPSRPRRHPVDLVSDLLRHAAIGLAFMPVWFAAGYGGEGPHLYRTAFALGTRDRLGAFCAMRALITVIARSCR